MNANASSPQDRLPAFDSLSQQVFLQLWCSYDRLKAIESEFFAAYDLSAQQYNALRLLAAAYPEGTPTMELGRRLISRMPDTTRMLDRLEKRKLIRRRRLPENRRVVEVAITPQGRRLLGEMDEGVRAMHERQLGHLDPSQQRQLIELLKLAREPHDEYQGVWRELSECGE